MQLNQLIAGVILIELRFSKAKILWLMSTHPSCLLSFINTTTMLVSVNTQLQLVSL